MSTFRLYFRALFGTFFLKVFSEKYTVKDHISNTKLEKGDHYYIQTQYKDLLSHYNLILRKIQEKMSRNVLMPPGHPVILLKSN